jgi:hypothetical protein
MSPNDILSLIDSEIASLKQARAVLSGTTAKLHLPTKIPKVAIAKKNKRNLSPEGRARIAAAQKARWAAKKRAEK